MIVLDRQVSGGLAAFTGEGGGESITPPLPLPHGGANTRVRTEAGRVTIQTGPENPVDTAMYYTGWNVLSGLAVQTAAGVGRVANIT